MYLLEAAFIWACSLRETNKLEVDNGNRGREGYWLNCRIILFGREQERPCPVQKKPSKHHNRQTLTASTVLLSQKKLFSLNRWRGKQQHLASASIVFCKPWGNQSPVFLSWKYRRSLEALAFGNGGISEEFMDDPDLISKGMNGNMLWDFRSAWLCLTFSYCSRDWKNSFFFCNWKAAHPTRNWYHCKQNTASSSCGPSRRRW